MRIRKRSAASDYLAANARISYQQPPLKRSPTVMPSTIHSPPLLHITQIETQKAETPRYNRGRRWRDLLTSLNSDEVKSEDPIGGNVTTKSTPPRDPCGARKYAGVEGQDANGSAQVIEGEGSTKVRNRKARGKIVQEERDRLRVGTSVSSSADIHEEDTDDGEVSERKMKKKKKSLKSLHGVLDEYHHQCVESPRCSFPSTSTSCANGVAQYLL